MNTEIEIWDQNKKRLFEQPKIEYTVRSINSLIKSRHDNLSFEDTQQQLRSRQSLIILIKKLFASMILRQQVLRLLYNLYLIIKKFTG